MPPSAKIVVAVEVAGAVAGEEGHDAADLLGLGHAARSGWPRRASSSSPGRPRSTALIGVSTAPGPTPTTRMPCGPSSTPAVRVSMRMPPFDRQYGGVAGHRPVLVDRGDVDDPAAAALGDHLLGRDLRAEERALQVDVHAPCRTAASVVSSTEVRVSTPALLTMMSSRPNVLTAVSTRRCRSATLLTSASTPIGLVAEGGDLLLELLGGLGVGDVVDDDVGALLGEGEDDAPCRCRCCRR